MAFDFKAARSAGYTDDEIVDYLAKDPNTKFDVPAALKAGYSSAEIVEHLAGDKKDAAKSDGLVDAFRQGVSGVVGGAGETLEQYVGKSGLSDALKNAGDAVRPENYQQASVFGEGGSIDQIPQGLVESAPGMGAGVAAARVAAKASPKLALPAAALAYLLMTRGEEAKRTAEARTGEAGAEPTAGDKARAVAYGIPEAALAAVGAGRFLPGVGTAKSIAGAGKQLAKTAAVEGGVGTGQSVIAQAGRTVGTEGGLQVDPREALDAGVFNAAAGGALGAPRAARTVSNTVKLRDFGGANADASTTVANRIKTAAADGNLANTKVAHDATKSAQLDIYNELGEAARGVEDLSTEVKNALNRAQKGNPLTSDDLAVIDASNAPDAAKRLAREATVIESLLNQGSTQGGRFKGGLSGKLDDSLRVLKNPTAVGATAGLGAVLGSGAGGVTGAFVVPALPALGATLAGYGALRALDRFTGARSPAKRFVDQFADSSKPIRPQDSAQGDDEALPLGPWNQPARPNVAGIGKRPVGAEDLPRGPWNQAPAPSVAGIGKRGYVDAPTPQEYRAERTIDEGITRHVDRLARRNEKDHVRTAQAALRKLAALQKPIDLPEDFRLPSQQPKPAPSVLSPEVLAAAKLAGWKMKLRDKSNALEAKDVAAQQKAVGEQAAEQIAATSPLVADAGGLEAIRNPAVGKRASALVSAANAIKKLKAEPSDEADASVSNEVLDLPPLVAKVTKSKGKVEETTAKDSGAQITAEGWRRAKGPYAHLSVQSAAEKTVADAVAAGLPVNRANYLRGTIERKNVQRAIAFEIAEAAGPAIDAQRLLGSIEGQRSQTEAAAYRDMLKRKFPDLADVIDSAFTPQRIKAGWKKVRSSQK